MASSSRAQSVQVNGVGAKQAGVRGQIQEDVDEKLRNISVSSR